MKHNTAFRSCPRCGCVIDSDEAYCTCGYHFPAERRKPVLPHIAVLVLAVTLIGSAGFNLWQAKQIGIHTATIAQMEDTIAEKDIAIEEAVTATEAAEAKAQAQYTKGYNEGKKTAIQQTVVDNGKLGVYSNGLFLAYPDSWQTAFQSYAEKSSGTSSTTGKLTLPSPSGLSSSTTTSDSVTFPDGTTISSGTEQAQAIARERIAKYGANQEG